STLAKRRLIEQALDEPNCQNFDLILTGHSLGAGIASILGLLMRPIYGQRLQVLAFSPPGGLLSLSALNYSKEFITSVVVGKDVIPPRVLVSPSMVQHHMADYVLDALESVAPAADFHADQFFNDQTINADGAHEEIGESVLLGTAATTVSASGDASSSIRASRLATKNLRTPRSSTLPSRLGPLTSNWPPIDQMNPNNRNRTSHVAKQLAAAPLATPESLSIASSRILSSKLSVAASAEDKPLSDEDDEDSDNFEMPMRSQLQRPVSLHENLSGYCYYLFPDEESGRRRPFDDILPKPRIDFGRIAHAVGNRQLLLKQQQQQQCSNALAAQQFISCETLIPPAKGEHSFPDDTVIVVASAMLHTTATANSSSSTNIALNGDLTGVIKKHIREAQTPGRSSTKTEHPGQSNHAIAKYFAEVGVARSTVYAILNSLRRRRRRICAAQCWFRLPQDGAQGHERGKKYIPEQQIWKWLTQLSLALRCCHCRQRREGSAAQGSEAAKTASWTLTGRNLKLGDFGLARVLLRHSRQLRQHLRWHAMQKSAYTEKSDIWSLGIVAYELACLRPPPFVADKQRDLATRIRRGEFEPPPDWYSPALRTLISDCLSVNPDHRTNRRRSATPAGDAQPFVAANESTPEASLRHWSDQLRELTDLLTAAWQDSLTRQEVELRRQEASLASAAAARQMELEKREARLDRLAKQLDERTKQLTELQDWLPT
uniref:non-specific serine/threonine protein kinase n=1 Tax=Macrostomum lignano TaxID=282301 RepID=A0A1I8F714_9PLAT